MKIQTTKTFEDLLNPNYRNYVFQGSSRAGKTYNIILWMVINILNENNKVYSIVRKTLPALKGSVLRDLKEILIKLDSKISIQSLLVHELQHALDDLKTAGQFRKEKGNYLDRQSEVNARLSQALNDIEFAFKKLNLKN